MARNYIIAGNWKMNRGRATEATELVQSLHAVLDTATSVEIVVCPPFTALSAASTKLSGTGIRLGAQDCFWKSTGAYTGQISPEMLVDLGVSHVILGHSERRGRFGVPEPDFTSDILQHFGDTDTTVNRKTQAAIAAGLIPIVCVGETKTEREAGTTDTIVREQVAGAVVGIDPEKAAALVFAYEPVWAIGTGLTCDAAEADRVCGIIRATIAAIYDANVSESVRVQYGGSMKPDNAADLLRQTNIDGGLIGGASLKASDFAAIIDAATSATR